MPLPKRKNLRLQNFSYSNGGSFFLTMCTKNREKLLSRIVPGTEGDYPYNGDGLYVRVDLTECGKLVEKRLRTMSKRPGVSVAKYVIMPDHIHLIVEVEEEAWHDKCTPTSELVPCFVSLLKRLCHKEIGRPIFQRGYIDHVIRNLRDREAVEHYIELNPARWYFRQTHPGTK